MSCKGVYLAQMLPLNINTKMGCNESHSSMSDLERSNTKSLRVRSLAPRKGAELGHIVLLNVNRNPYMGSPMAPRHLTLSYLASSSSMPPRFERFYLLTLFRAHVA